MLLFTRMAMLDLYGSEVSECYTIFTSKFLYSPYFMIPLFYVFFILQEALCYLESSVLSWMFSRLPAMWATSTAILLLRSHSQWCNWFSFSCRYHSETRNHSLFKYLSLPKPYVLVYLFCRHTLCGSMQRIVCRYKRTLHSR